MVKSQKPKKNKKLRSYVLDMHSTPSDPTLAFAYKIYKSFVPDYDTQNRPI